MSEISAQWLHATLTDAAEALADSIRELDESPDSETAEHVLCRELVNVYAKLNYAVNSAYLGPAALSALSEDELIAWPSGMPFLTFDEIDALNAEDDDEEDDEAGDDRR